MRRHVIIPIFIPHVGCPHDCVFCNQAKITGVLRDEYDSIDAEYVRRIVRDYLETIDRDNTTLEVSFFGGTFTAIDIRKQRELLSVTKELKETGIIDKIRLSTRPDYINLFILSHLKEYLVDIIELGVQSLSEDVLEASKRGYSPKAVEDASNMIRSFGFTLGHQLMTGLPLDTEDKDLFSVRESIRMKPDIARIYPALVIRDTEMADLYLAGSYEPYSLDRAVAITSKMLSEYEKAGVNVIRVGLQPTDEIAPGRDVLAGPYHPAIRELCESYTMCLKIEEAGFDKVTVRIGKRDLSKLYAGGKRYFRALSEKIEVKVEVSGSDQKGIFEIIPIDGGGTNVS
ncbi:elongator complex protein 3 [Youngiibacter multivorans]|uniref:Histone acetyltransferase (RNA polymerase elongator complex component) n=1 Tax=Youngiibacter multivorans TaxID=937251 RepID=A0ABS4G1Y0_9CLOT|nr:radical SAM protein [Youngiibacter multivorans]MBP1918544.1 histone acetyltransferase (RNA polymerase elongator complex component) [Youngiibacter multivorans]